MRFKRCPPSDIAEGGSPGQIPVSRRLDPRPVLEEDARLVQATVGARQVQRGQPLLVPDLREGGEPHSHISRKAA